MIKFADIHTHINFGVDDGSRSLEESICMMDALYDEGARIAFATHHYGIRNKELDPEAAARRVEILRRIAEDRYENFLIFPGCEIYYRPGIVEELKSGRAPCLAGSRYVLIEFDPAAKTEKIIKGVRDCMVNGYRPVVAHADKIYGFLYEPEDLQKIINAGGYVQINAACLADNADDYIWAKEQVLAGRVHFIASDCHRMEWRPPEIKEGACSLVKIAGREKASHILVNNPIKIIRNEVI